MTMKIYLDNCCYNRPYDDQEQLRISLETQAKMYIQNIIRENRVSLVSSYILRYEISRNPHINIRENITNFIENYSSEYVGEEYAGEAGIEGEKIRATGIKKLDSLHLACAICARADWFITTDDRILKYKDDRIKIVNPIDFIREMEEKI